jgi:hypothetical protein
MSYARTRIRQWSAPWDAAGVGSTNNGLTAESAQASTLTRPVTDLANGRHIVDLHPVPDDEDGPKDEPVHLAIGFASQDAANETYSVRLWGWRKFGDVWIAQLLSDLDLTAGSRTGAAAAENGPDNTWFLPDTITINTDTTRNASIEANGGVSAGNGHLFITMDACGFELIEIETSTDGVAAAVRVFIAPM